MNTKPKTYATCGRVPVSLEYAYSLDFGSFLKNTETADGERYFYHSDHLGSSAYITTEMRSIREDLQKSNATEQNGYATQFLAYMPYGETLAEQQNGTSYYSPFKFSAKEKDPETGYSYFGARYYSPELSVWLSVDPLSDEFPSWTPYHYVHNNPVNMIDRDGRKADWVESADGNIYWDENATSQNTTKDGEKYLGKNVLVATHGRDAAGNEPVNSAKFELYLESDKTGPSATIMGNTVPSDVSSYGTLAEGLYSAKFGRRNAAKYKNELAIRIYNLDGTDGLPTLNGNPNPRSNGKTLTGVLFHSGNPYLKSLRDRAGNPVWSHGCQTSGSGPGSAELHRAFMSIVGKNFSGTYYLRSKPQPAQKGLSLPLPYIGSREDNTYVSPR